MGRGLSVQLLERLRVIATTAVAAAAGLINIATHRADNNRVVLAPGDEAPDFELTASDWPYISAVGVSRTLSSCDRVVSQSVHRRMHGRMRIDRRQQSDASSVQRRVLWRQRRPPGHQSPVRRVDGDRLPDSERSRKIGGARLWRARSQRIPVALDVLRRHRRAHSADRQSTSAPECMAWTSRRR